MIRYIVLFALVVAFAGCKKGPPKYDYHYAPMWVCYKSPALVTIDPVTMTARPKTRTGYQGFIIANLRFMPYTYEYCTRGYKNFKFFKKGQGTFTSKCKPVFSGRVALLKKGYCTVVTQDKKPIRFIRHTPH